MAPPTPLAALSFAESDRLKNLGMATADIMPRITITMISSIRVKPPSFFLRFDIIFFLLFKNYKIS
jgi:hypothetical protein